MHKFFSLVFISWPFIFPVYSQAGAEQLFSLDKLTKPIENSAWFDSRFDVVFIDKYDLDKARCLSIKNGYAKYELGIESNLPLSENGLIPIGVDVVYTHYPISKSDWRTNYYELLASRVEELLNLDSSLNSSDIEWRFIMQTQCNNELQAKSLFHGVVVKYGHQVPRSIVILELEKLPTPKVHSPPIQILLAESKLQQAVDYAELESILYPESVFNHDLKQHIPATQKRRNEPGCSKFPTRADRPRQNIWSRLFR